MNITEDKLKAGIQIALGTLGLYTEEAETLLIHHIKALTIPVVVGQSEQLVCDIEKGTRCKDSFPRYEDGKCRICGGQAN